MIEALEEIKNSENQQETARKIIATLSTNCGNCKLWLKCPQSAYFTEEQDKKHVIIGERNDIQKSTLLI